MADRIIDWGIARAGAIAGIALAIGLWLAHRQLPPRRRWPRFPQLQPLPDKR